MERGGERTERDMKKHKLERETEKDGEIKRPERKTERQRERCREMGERGRERDGEYQIYKISRTENYSWLGWMKQVLEKI